LAERRVRTPSLHSSFVTDQAWQLAHSAAERAGVRLRDLDAPGDADLVREVIDRVWGEQAPPQELLRALQHAGCVLFGACGDADADIVGFVFGFLGFRDGFHLHSHMLAVVPERQVAGVGYALKLAQRAAALDAGIDEVRWTYDPLAARNGRFNLGKLGAIATRFLPEFYGEMIDRLNRGDRSDRFEVRWRLRSEHVTAALTGPTGQPPVPAGVVEVLAADEGERWPRPLATGATLDRERGAVVVIPADHLALRTEDPGLGRAWRDATSEAFEACFRAELVATTFVTPGPGLGGYLFERRGADTR